MPNSGEAYSVIDSLDGKVLKGRTPKVDKAKPRTEYRDMEEIERLEDRVGDGVFDKPDRRSSLTSLD